MSHNKITDFNQQRYPSVNRKFKSDIFCLVFQSKKDALSLYNALNGSDYQDENLLEINTLEDAIYLSIKNDISFLIGGTMNLYEHQSTYNPNMPVRGFLYLARLYDQYIELNGINLYTGTLKELPSPRYIVFYNGTEEVPERSVLKLSDAFTRTSGTPGISQETENTVMSVPCLECMAVMLNINYGHNRELMQKCRKLEEYALFVSTVRTFIASGSNLQASVSEAVDDCIDRDVLRDILLKNKSEVMSMVLTTFDREKYEKAMQEEWKEMGIEEGQARINRLNLLLAEHDRADDIVKAAADPEYQEQLFREFDI